MCILAQVQIPSINFLFAVLLWGLVHAGGQVHGALLGRTFLRHFKMIYDGATGGVEITEDDIEPVDSRQPLHRCKLMPGSRVNAVLTLDNADRRKTVLL